MLSFPTQTALDWGPVKCCSFNCTVWVDLSYLSLGADQSSGQEREKEKGEGEGERGGEDEKGRRGREMRMEEGREGWID